MRLHPVSHSGPKGPDLIEAQQRSAGIEWALFVIPGRKARTSLKQRCSVSHSMWLRVIPGRKARTSLKPNFGGGVVSTANFVGGYGTPREQTHQPLGRTTTKYPIFFKVFQVAR